MALNTPDSAAVVDARSKADVQTALSLVNGDPFLRNSWLGALITAYANRVFDFYFALDQAALEALPDTATAAGNLERWAAIFGITRIAGTQSTGNVIATGTVGNTIPLATLYSAGDGSEYEVTAAATITAFAGVAITSITNVTTTATVTTTAPHGLGSNVPVTISGAVEPPYNGTFEITVTGASTFTYEMASDPGGAATGVPVGAWDIATVPVESVEFGTDQDQLADAIFTLQSPIVGVDDVANADQSALTGGADQETDAALRARLLDRIANPVAHFNEADIENIAKTVPGVTRVFVEPVTPALGQVTIYPLRDNDVDGPIPDAGELTTIKTAILTITPANTDPDDVFVLGATEVVTAFTFTALTPNTTTMQSAITASLEQFFAESTEVGVDVDEDAYRSAIFNSVDLSSGATVETFTLSTPSGDIIVAAGFLATLGTITYP